ncbi:MAG: hypothetical protein AB1898_06375 [Acidobacteriota bacterium]
MSKTSKLLIVFGFLGFLAYVVYSTLDLHQYSCEVCMEFRGQTDCRTAAGETEAEAVRTAIENACAQIASGMTDSIACTQTPPKSVNCKQR